MNREGDTARPPDSFSWSGRWELNPRPSAWEAGALRFAGLARGFAIVGHLLTASSLLRLGLRLGLQYRVEAPSRLGADPLGGRARELQPLQDATPDVAECPFALLIRQPD